MRTALLNFICAAALFAPTVAFAQNDINLNDVRDALRKQQASGSNASSSRSRDVNAEENSSSASDSPSYDDENEEFPIAFELSNPNGEYEKNEPFSLTVKTKTDGFLYVFNVSSDGAREIFPNRNTNQNSIRAGETRQIPGVAAGYRWRFTGEFTKEKIVVALSKNELNDEIKAEICKRCAKRLKNTSNQKWIEIEDEANVWFADALLKLKNSNGGDSNGGDSNGGDSNGEDSNGEDSNGGSARPRRFAVFFAHTNYVDSKTGKFTTDDLAPFTIGSIVRSMRAAKDFGKFDSITLLSGSELSEPNVYAVFDQLKKNAKPGDEIFLYWLGHGMPWPPTDSERDRTHESLLLSTVKGETADNGNTYVDPTDETTIQDDEMADLLAQLSECKVVFLLQACFSGGIIEDKAVGSFVFRNVPRYSPDSMNELIEEFVDQPYDYDEFLKYVPQAMDFSDVKTTANNGDSLKARVNRLKERRNENVDYTKELASSIFAKVRSKDVRRDAKNLTILATSLESQTSNAAVVVNSEQGAVTTCGEYSLPICPLDFALLTVLTDKTGKYVKKPGHVEVEDLWNVASKFIPANGKRLSRITEADQNQTPVYFNNIGEIYLAP